MLQLGITDAYEFTEDLVCVFTQNRWWKTDCVQGLRVLNCRTYNKERWIKYGVQVRNMVWYVHTDNFECIAITGFDTRDLIIINYL